MPDFQTLNANIKEAYPEVCWYNQFSKKYMCIYVHKFLINLTYINFHKSLQLIMKYTIIFIVNVIWPMDFCTTFFAAFAKLIFVANQELKFNHDFMKVLHPNSLFPPPKIL